MSKQPLTTEQSAALENVFHLFASWWKTKTGQERIPEQLCQTAADLYHTWKMIINRIARGLRLIVSLLPHRFEQLNNLLSFGTNAIRLGSSATAFLS